MPTALRHVTPDTPMGATLVAGGVTFRVWAPGALHVHAVGDFNDWQRSDASLLNRDAHGHWLGFIEPASEFQQYLFHVVGTGDEGCKRDPCARELGAADPRSRCILRSPAFAWHESAYRPPDFADLVIYQLHVGTFHAPNWPRHGGTFLDVALKLPHLSELGVTALQLLPIQEFRSQFSEGYNGTDYYSPERDFAVLDADLDPYLSAINALLAGRHQAAYARDDLHGEMNQLKALIDLCHLHGIAVLLDVVYNHAGGGFDDESLWFFDRQPRSEGNASSLYFTDKGHAGGLIFDYAKPEVRDFLISNARFFLDEYRVDGFRYDQVSVIDHDGAPEGWRFCQDLTATLRFHRPNALNHAEYWGVNPWIVAPSPAGAGFDTTLTDGLREAVRDVISSASAPDARPLAMSRLGDSLWPAGFTEAWRFVQGPENHDLVYLDQRQRVARLGQPDDPRSWYARSRARVATGIGLTAPGIPMLFMGQEFLANKQWCDNLETHADLRIDWVALDLGNKQMQDHVRFTRELIALRLNQPALRGQGMRVICASDADRVLVFQRWVEGQGRDVVVAIHLGTSNRDGYRVGLPAAGRWSEVFNSDAYENWINPDVVGNGGSVDADGPPMHGFDQSASLVLPANSLLVFAR